MDKVTLKAGKEKALLKRHPWIFSGAIESLPSCEAGEILSVFSSSGKFLAKAYFNTQNSIAGRVLTFLDEPIKTLLSNRIDQAISLRSTFFDSSLTNCYRLINAEGDGIPGLIVDLYADVVVIQINTAGIDRLRPQIVELLVKKLSPKAIFEKSVSSARKLEGLSDQKGFLYGSYPDEVIVCENGIEFYVSLEKGQKTGFFLDQREMRQKIKSLSKNRRVLNCFSYSGGFSLYALKGRASHVTSVDCNADALRLAHLNTERNGFDLSSHRIEQQDVFSFLKHNPLDFDLIILDPPAFAKRKSDLIPACSGYKEINRLTIEKCPPSSLLLTCSCSHFIDEELFQNVVFQAAMDAGREVQILSRHSQAADHPISLSHPEGDYLKSLLLYVK